MKIRVMIIEDHPLMQEGLAGALSRDPGIEIVGRAGTGEEGIALAAAQKPDVMLLDLHLPDMGGVAILERLAAQQPGAHRLELSLEGGGRATFQLPVTARRATDATAHALQPSYRAAAGETVTVGFHVTGAAPRDAEVLAFSTGTVAAQVRVAARRVGPGHYEARLQVPQPGTYRVQLESEQANLGTRSGRASTLEVTR